MKLDDVAPAVLLQALLLAALLSKVLGARYLESADIAASTTTLPVELTPTGGAWADAPGARRVGSSGGGGSGGGGGGGAPVGVAPRIINGEVDSSLQYFPYVGYVNWNGVSSCSGSLVGEGYVLTAAHCFLDVEERCVAGAEEVQVWLYGAWYTAEEVHVHPDYYSRDSVDPSAQSNDVALLKLSSWPLNVTPVALPTTAELWEGQTVWAAGYGLTEEGTPSDVLRYTDLVVLPDSPVTPRFTDEFIAGGTSGYTCIGDSGGPVVLESNSSHTLVGLTSRGPEDCTVSFSFYVDVLEHMGQIAAWMLEGGDSSNSTSDGSSASEGSAVFEDSTSSEGSTSEGSTSEESPAIDPGLFEGVEGVLDQVICSLFGC